MYQFPSPGFGYVLQALMDMEDTGDYLHVRDLAQQHDLPSPYLSKLFQLLANGGVLESARGPKGGFRLARPADRISLSDILHLLHGERGAQPGGLPCSTCATEGGGNPCILHAAWIKAQEQWESFLGSTSLGDLKRRQERKAEHQMPLRW